MKIGSHVLLNNLMLAPMAGVTDKPFRLLCRRLGAGVAVSEMVTSDPSLYRTRKTRLRLDHSGEPAPRVVQIVGADPGRMAEAARYNADRGADIIDINMGCPARKVGNAMAGSALLENEQLVARILERVVSSVAVPVTLKLRTGPDPRRRNGVGIARIAEQAGVSALAVHGRTRQCGFRGAAEHDTTRIIKHSVTIPVIANGDVCTPGDAARVLAETGADGLMIGRAALGNPWIFRDISTALESGTAPHAPDGVELERVLTGHLEELYGFYGADAGVRIARKHIGWYLRGRPGAGALLERINRSESTREQIRLVRGYCAGLRSLREAA